VDGLVIAGIVLACVNLICVGGNVWSMWRNCKKNKQLDECLAKLRGGER